LHDRPSDVLFALILAVAIAYLVYRYAHPDLDASLLRRRHPLRRPHP
jgi:membrane-associated phospholipid phosphatase